MTVTLRDLQQAYSTDVDEKKQAEEALQKFDESLVEYGRTRTPAKSAWERMVAGTKLHRVVVAIGITLSFLTVVFQFLQQVLPQILEFLSKLFHF